VCGKQQQASDKERKEKVKVEVEEEQERRWTVKEQVRTVRAGKNKGRLRLRKELRQR
jgi:hypothetical protein